MNKQSAAVKPSRSRNRRATSRPAPPAQRGYRRRHDARPDPRPAGTIKVLTVEHSVRFHVTGCDLLGAEIDLPSSRDLAASRDAMASARGFGRDGDYDQSRLPARRRVLVQWRTPSLIPPARQCTCLRRALAA